MTMTVQPDRVMPQNSFRKIQRIFRFNAIIIGAGFDPPPTGAGRRGSSDRPRALLAFSLFSALFSLFFRGTGKYGGPFRADAGDGSPVFCPLSGIIRETARRSGGCPPQNKRRMRLKTGRSRSAPRLAGFGFAVSPFGSPE
ncbi:MAG TPA: hypothetical protein VJY34_06890 [Roseiarcus sp.]|nr:hypothetical protein [Roseiarcus sp.]